MKVSVIGVGYVGIITAVSLAELGHDVLGMDDNKEKVKSFEKGISPIYEEGLEEALNKNIEKRTLSFTDSIEKAISHGEVIFICVGTPSLPGGRADLSYVERVAREIAKNAKEYKLIVEKSTVPVKTSEQILKTIKLYNKHGVELEVASNPEFLREGTALQDFFEADRIVIGVSSKKAENLLKELYKGIDSPVVVTDPNTAEIIKHASNSFLAMKISFINMVADLCENTGADINKVAEGMGFDKRIGKSFLNAGIGYGGSCFPKDVRAFNQIGKENGLDFSLLKDVDKINMKRVERFISKLRKAHWVFKDKVFSIWGLAFKPGTDDIREAPALKVMEILLNEGANLRVYDPKAMDNVKKVFPSSDKLYYANDPFDAAKDSEAILLITEWDEFKDINFSKIKEIILTNVLIDGRNLYSSEKMKEEGFIYYPVGKPPIEE
jgi:UDPglucose 6-dehydrogenase